MSTFVTSLSIFLVIMIFLVAALLFVEKNIFSKRNINILVNGSRNLSTEKGRSLLESLAEHRILLPSACGGHGKCTTCACIITSNENKIQLACQTVVTEFMTVEVPAHVFGAKSYSATVRSNRPVNNKSKLLTLEVDNNELLPCLAGTHIKIFSATTPTDESFNKAYSLSGQKKNTRHLVFNIKQPPSSAPAYASYLYDLHEGHKITFTGPHRAKADNP